MTLGKQYLEKIKELIQCVAVILNNGIAERKILMITRM